MWLILLIGYSSVECMPKLSLRDGSNYELVIIPRSLDEQLESIRSNLVTLVLISKQSPGKYDSTEVEEWVGHIEKAKTIYAKAASQGSESKKKVEKLLPAILANAGGVRLVLKERSCSRVS